MKQIRRHVTYANVMSSLAVFLILGGATAFAAVKKVGPNEIKANSIKTGKIVKEAVTAGKIKNLAVTEAKLADGAVTTNKIADNAVTAPKIAKDAVTTEKILNNAVTNGKIANDAVTDGKLANEAVITGKLANSAVTSGKLANGSVTGAKIGTTSFTFGPVESAPANSVDNDEVSCPAGQKMLSGGVINSDFDKELKVLGTYPNATNTWKGVVYNSSGAPLNFRVLVLCVN